MSAIHATLKRVLGFCGIGETYVSQNLNKPNAKFYFGRNQKKQLVLTHGTGQRTGYPNKPSNVVQQWVVGSLFSPTDANDWDGRIFDFKTALEVLRSQPVTETKSVAPTLPSGGNMMLAALQQTMDTNVPTQVEIGKVYVLNASNGYVTFSAGNTTHEARQDIDVLVHAELTPGRFVVSLTGNQSYVTTVDRSRLKGKNEQLFSQIEKSVNQLVGLDSDQKKELMSSIKLFVKHYSK